MQKIRTLPGFIFLVLWVFSQSAYAQAQTCHLQIGNMQAGAGETLKVPVAINNAPNSVQAFGFDLTL